MMTFSHTRLDLQRLADPEHPVELVARTPGQTWLMAYAPVDFNKEIDWRRSVRGDFVSVPLVPYLTNPELDLSMGFMIQLGVYLTQSLKVPISRLHLAIGTPVSEIPYQDSVPAWRFYLGFAALLTQEFPT